MPVQVPMQQQQEKEKDEKDQEQEQEREKERKQENGKEKEKRICRLARRCVRAASAALYFSSLTLSLNLLQVASMPFYPLAPLSVSRFNARLAALVWSQMLVNISFTLLFSLISYSFINLLFSYLFLKQ